MNPLKSLLISFSHAWRGILVAFKTERSFRIQLAVGLLVIAFLLIFPIPRFEKVALLLVIGAVLVLELVNSMIERMVDLFKPRLHQYVKDIKDLMAGAVLIASIFAVIIGLIILGPYFVKLLDLI
ncbi:MAG: diacylglycerol kinase family protein [Patescibacteria group bacterium]|nr:diacylglycerol kinase family protein [Patescibacteria group bacterium]